MRKALGLIIATVVATAAHAGGGGMGGIVFDPTNFSKNTITAAQTVQQTAKQAQAYVTQLQQYRVQLEQLRSMDPSRAMAMLAQNEVDLRDAVASARSLETLYGSVQNLRGSFTQRLDAAKSLGLTWEQYVQKEQGRLNKNQDAAMQRAREDFRVMERVQKDYEFAREAESKIPATAGTHEAMQLMNVQMNRLVTQNAELMRGLMNAMAGENSAEKQAQANEKEQRELEKQARASALTKARREADIKAVTDWKASTGVK